MRMTGSLMRSNWSPLMLPGIQLFLDAKNVETNGSNVSNWIDTSGNNRNYSQSIILNQPTYVDNVFNNNPAIRFNGLLTQLDCVNTTGLLNNVSSCTIAMVIQKPTAGDTGVGFYISNTDADATKLAVFNGNGGQFAFFGRRLDGDTSQTVTIAGLSANQPYIQIHSVNYSTATIITRINGTQTVNTTFKTAGNTTAGNPIASRIGRGSNLVYFNGYIGNIILWHGSNISDIQKLEWYLLYQKNILSLLPTNHQYRYSRP